MTQDELKALVGRAALDHVVPGELVGVGTGSTVDKFIDALPGVRIAGAVGGPGPGPAYDPESDQSLTQGLVGLRGLRSGRPCRPCRATP